MTVPARSNRERFEDYVQPVPFCGCWLFDSADKREYPSFVMRREGGGGRHRRNYKTTKAHRASWEIYRGEIPGDKIVCHKCDNPCCVNPDHLYIGTYQDNADDRKGNRYGFPA